MATTTRKTNKTQTAAVKFMDDFVPAKRGTGKRTSKYDVYVTSLLETTDRWVLLDVAKPSSAVDVIRKAVIASDPTLTVKSAKNDSGQTAVRSQKRA